MAKIERVDVILRGYPLQGYFKFFGAMTVRNAIFVRITADNGVVGWGQSLPVTTWSFETPEAALVALRHYFGPALIGRDPLDMDAAQAALDKALAPSFGMPLPITRAGIDMALWDLAGKLTGRGVAEMWGWRTGGSVTLSWTVNVRSLEEAEQQVALGRSRGYRNFNLKVAPDAAFDVALARRVRQLAPQGFLWADANCGYDLPTALAVAPRLADAGVDVLEAPLPPTQFRGYQALRRQKALPITMDEGIVSAAELEEFIHLGMIDGLTVKLSRCGGLTGTRRQIELCREHGLFCLGSGLSDPDVSLAASLVAFAAFELARPAALNGPQFLTQTALAPPLAIHGDQAQVPTGPGLGIEVDAALIETLPPGDLADARYA